MGVRWGQHGSDFQLQNGLMQFVILFLSLMLGYAHAEARTKRSQSAKVEFKHQHPCPATGSPKGPCKGYVIDHIVPIACHGADAPGNMQWQTVADAKAKDKWECKGCGEWVAGITLGHNVSSAAQPWTLKQMTVLLTVFINVKIQEPSIHKGYSLIFDPLRGPLQRIGLGLGPVSALVCSAQCKRGF